MSLSRRSLFKAAAGCAMLPPAASASQAVPSDIPIDAPPSLRAQFEQYSALLADIIRKMHPGITDIIGPALKTHEDGSFAFAMGGGPDFQEFSGDGLYDLSEIGAVATYFIEKHSRPSPRPDSYYLCYPAFNGRIHWDDHPRQRSNIRILRRRPDDELASLLRGSPRNG